MNQGISVIICSYNSQDRIKKVLDCLQAQQNCDGISWEVIMVDNASTDNVVEVATKSWKHSKVPFHIIHEPRQGQSYATRTGIENAVHDIIILVDDDNYVSPNYISKAFAIMNTHPEVGIAGGIGIGQFEKDPPEWFKVVEQAFAIGPQAENEGYVSDDRGYIYGAGSILRKSIYDYLLSNRFQLMLKGRIGKSLVAGEDSERSHAFRMLGYKLWYDPSLEFKHYMPAKRINWIYVRKLYRSFGRASVYHRLYGEVLENYHGIRAVVAQSAFLSILNIMFRMLRILPSYFNVIFQKPNHGKEEILRFDFLYGNLLERISNPGRIKRYRKRLKHAEWRKSNPQEIKHRD